MYTYVFVLLCVFLAAPAYMYTDGGYHMFEGRTHRRGNKHAGVLVAVSAKMVVPVDVAQVEVGAGSVRGRAIMVRITQRTSLDMTTFSVNCPLLSRSTTRSIRR